MFFYLNSLYQGDTKRCSRNLIKLKPIFVFNLFLTSQRATSANITSMTKAQAKTWCENYMNSSPTFLTCQDIPNINSTRAVEICVMDILVSEILNLLLDKYLFMCIFYEMNMLTIIFSYI